MLGAFDVTSLSDGTVAISVDKFLQARQSWYANMVDPNGAWLLPKINDQERDYFAKWWIMKIVIAPDSYKESLSAMEVANAIEAGFREIYPNAYQH